MNKTTLEFTSKDFLNRDLSWLGFNKRVLSEAGDINLPLMERVKYLAISKIIMDDFFKIRIPLLHNYVSANPEYTGAMKDILNEVSDTVTLQEIYFNGLFDKARKLSIFDKVELVRNEYVSDTTICYINSILKKSQVHVLKKGTKFDGLLKSGIPYLVARTKINGRSKMCLIDISNLQRVFMNKGKLIYLEDILESQYDRIDALEGIKVYTVRVFRIIREELVYLDAKCTDSIKCEMIRSMDARPYNNICILEHGEDLSDDMLSCLHNDLNTSGVHTLEITDKLIGTNYLMDMFTSENLKDHRFGMYAPRKNPNFKQDVIFDAIDKEDIFLHHPFDSHEHVVEFLEIASNDDKVSDIYITIYRTNKRIIRALTEAVGHGKNVHVMVELTAQSDEQKNIGWSDELELFGCEVSYGVRGLKVHGKMCCVVRDGKYYAHVGTGNYNNNDNSTFVDTSIFTSDIRIAKDVYNTLVNLMKGEVYQNKDMSIILAPHDIRHELYKRIDREVANALEGKKAEINIKVNGMTDIDFISNIYRACMSGVKVNLIVRGACCVKSAMHPNLNVYSLIGKFLEHGRTYIFENDGNPEVLVGSIDCMPKKLDQRVDILYPVFNEKHKQSFIDLMNDMLRDNVKLRYQSNRSGNFHINRPLDLDSKDVYCYQDEYCK